MIRSKTPHQELVGGTDPVAESERPPTEETKLIKLTGLLAVRTEQILAYGLVTGVVCWNLIMIFPATRGVAYVNDSAVHEQMVRFAASDIAQGRAPSTQWYPYLNLGSPQFLHYQQLGALLVGALGAVFNPTIVFHWSSYLLVACWPVAIYASSRILGMPRLAAGIAAALSPFLVSVPGVGYEQKAYLWVGFGLWAQLCGSWALPLAWATTWRAMTDPRFLLPAATTVSVTIALHFETGYLALGAVLLMPFLCSEELPIRLKHAGLLLAGSLASSAWVTIPLLLNAKWAAVNTYLSATGLVRGYGARQDLAWLVSGNTFDDGRLPVVSLGVLCGCVLGCTAYRRFAAARPAIGMFVFSLLLSFGPTTWGPLTNLVPGHTDIFFRRFLIGVQLAGIYLAGLGFYLLATAVLSALARSGRLRALLAGPRRLEAGRTALAVLLTALALAPALVELRAYDRHNAALIGDQAATEKANEPKLAPLLAYVRTHGGGRVFAGSPLTGGNRFTIGFVPIYEFLANQNIDAVGFTLRTASLMSQPENFFDPAVPSDYSIFGVRYLLLPAGQHPRVPAAHLMTSGLYALWEVPHTGYLSVVRPAGTLREDRQDVGQESIPLLRSTLFSRGLDPIVKWTTTNDGYRLPAGHQNSIPRPLISAVDARLANDEVSATVTSTVPAVTVLSASYDPGWQAWVNGRPAATMAMAPALVGVRIPAGVSHVRFAYVGFAWYPELLAFSILGLVALWYLSVRLGGSIVAPKVVNRSGEVLTLGAGEEPRTWVP
jgi:Bacterial membrane protein YfhO